MRRLLRCGVSARRLDPLALPCRLCATTPTEDDVLLAYKTLGVHATASLAEVKKRFGTLAKEHHPDVATTTTATSGTSKMTDINAAYNTVKQFYQAGGRLTSHRATSSAGGPSSAYYTNHDGAYQPWHEDMDPLMYELMWEEMRRHNEEENLGNLEGGFPGMGGGGQWRPPRNNYAGGRSGKQRQSPPGKNGNDKTQQPNKGAGATASTTTWPEEQVKAMVNMYQDGKSFEFIANALGKPNAAAVVEEFNRWSTDSNTNRRRNGSNGNRNNNSNRRRRPSNRPHDFYYANSPDDIPFELYEMMEEEPYYDGTAESGNPFGYYGGDGDAYDDQYGGPTPFYGGHQMSGGVPSYASSGSGPHTHNSNRNASFRPSRHQRGGVPHKPKRHTNSQNGNNR